MTRKIQLQNSMVSLIDDEDLDRVSQHRWSAVQPNKRADIFYATTNINGRTVYMHRMIMGAQPGEEVDHRSRNGLDNRRENLRLATSSQNKMNQKLRSDSTSGHKGVSWSPKRQKFQVYIQIDRKRVPLGRFATFEEAVAVREAAEKQHYGEFARAA